MEQRKLEPAKKYLWDCRLSRKQYMEFLRFIKANINLQNIYRLEEIAQYIKGWFESQNVDSYPMVDLILHILEGCSWKLMLNIHNVNYYVGIYPPKNINTKSNDDIYLRC